MTGKFYKVDKAFLFFSSKLKIGEPFELIELANFTEWNESTIKTYTTKRWKSILIKTGSNYTVSPSFSTFNLETFRQKHSQKDHQKKFFYQLLVEKAVNACVSAIEIYNKPDFKFREETFSILMVNAWELMLKAKILSMNNDEKNSIYFKDKGSNVKSASGNPKTISISRAINILESSCEIKNIVTDNIRLLIEIRDEAVHFVHNDTELAIKVQAIGMASLKNFMTLAMNWFGFDFKKYNFYLMPVSFFHVSDMTSFSIDKDAKNNLVKYLKKVEKTHESDEDPLFSVSLTLETKLVKTTSDEAIQIRVTDNPFAPEIKISEEDALKSYPHTHQKLCEILKERYINFKINKKFHQIMSGLKSQGEQFCKERRLDPHNPKSIYKMFYHSRIIEELDKYYTVK